MFTGIIESLGTISDIRQDGGNIHFTVSSPLSGELKIDQSLAHDGVCLTVVAIDSESSSHTVTAIRETLEKSNLRTWGIGRKVNLERCMPVNGRLDGHIVQGHVDLTGECISVREEEGSWRFRIRHPRGPFTTVEKGSICVNGVSLTVVDSTDDGFSVAIIPYTHEHTTFHQLKEGDPVNLEFDIIGKYVARLMKNQGLNTGLGL